MFRLQNIVAVQEVVTLTQNDPLTAVQFSLIAIFWCESGLQWGFQPRSVSRLLGLTPAPVGVSKDRPSCTALHIADYPGQKDNVQLLIRTFGCLRLVVSSQINT